MDSKVMEQPVNSAKAGHFKQASFAPFADHMRKPSSGMQSNSKKSSEESAPNFEQIIADTAKNYKSNEPPVGHEDEDEEDKKKLIGGSNMSAEHQRIVGSQDMRPGRALLVDLEISQIKEETNSREGTSQLTRNKSNFLGSAASPIGDSKFFLNQHRPSLQSQQRPKNNDDELMQSESAPDFSDIFQQKEVGQRASEPMDDDNFLNEFRNSDFQPSESAKSSKQKQSASAEIHVGVPR